MKTSKQKSSFIFSCLAFFLFSFKVNAETFPSFADEEIGKIVIVMHQADIDAGQSINDKTKSHQVNQFATYMVADHKNMKKEIIDYLKNKNLMAKESPMSQSLKQESDQNINKLKSLKGPELEKAYINNEVTYHEKIVDLATKLMDQAKDHELKKLLLGAKSTLSNHLVHAKKVQESMK